jgi:hypothetical protein
MAVSYSRRLVLTRVPGAAQREAKRNGALQTRDRRSLWRSRISGAPLHFVTRCTASGTHDSVGGVRSLIHFSNSLPRSRGAFLRPGFASLLHSPRIEGWAERRETFGCSAEHPWGLPSCVKDARERAYDAAGQAPSEAPCVP